MDLILSAFSKSLLRTLLFAICCANAAILDDDASVFEASCLKHDRDMQSSFCSASRLCLSQIVS